MLNLFIKNRAYLFSTFLIIFYPMIVFIVIIMLLDPSEKAIALDKLTHYAFFSLLSYVIYFVLTYQDKIRQKLSNDDHFQKREDNKHERSGDQ